MASKTHDDFDFSSLSLKDLLEARDLYHFHLMNKANVVGTAVGLYLIRRDEDWPQSRGEGASPKRKLTYARTFSNSEVRDYSWPCILVLVSQWIEEYQFGKEGKAQVWDAVPKRLDLPDGRSVPVCVVVAPPMRQDETPPLQPVTWPQAIFGGGLPLHVENQQAEHFATIGCLVSDGHTTYALTARHACGEPGTPIGARLRSGVHPIGVSSDKQITRRLFSEVYPALPLRQTYLGLDVGLVRLDNIQNWTPNIYGLSKIKPLFDIYEQSLSLRKLIDHPVVAVGAASGLLQGRIKAMFYRYRSVGGFDYVSDFLIAPANGEVGAHPGDSGALWHLQMPGPDGKEDTRPLTQRDLKPLAIEWGAQIFAESEERSTFSVATSLSNICKLLDVELVVEGNTDVSGTWGAVGHFSIATLAIDQVKNKTLKAFLKANADLISLPLDDLHAEPKRQDLLESGFVALADVPDIVWKNFPAGHKNSKGQENGVKGGRDTAPSGFSSTGPEHPNHHCDADMPFDGFKTLPEACIANPQLITAADWNRYFDAFPPKDKPDVLHRGILPFRVWQHFERMKEYAADKPDLFIAAAGTLAHYVGDSSQPLHGSTMADGIKDEKPDIPRDSPTRKEKDKKTPKPAFRGEGIHSIYETEMINLAAKKGELFPLIASNLGSDHGMALVKDGRGAAVATLSCMAEVAKILPPRTLIDRFEKSFAHRTPGHAQALWNAFDDETGKVMALGVQTLAMIWDAAWKAGGGTANHGRRNPGDLRAAYENPNFLRSVTVKEIEREIATPSPLGAQNKKPKVAALPRTRQRKNAKKGSRK